MITMQVMVIGPQPKEEFVNNFEEYMKKNDTTFKVKEKKVVFENGIDVIKSTYTQVQNDVSIENRTNIFSKNGKTYLVNFIIADIVVNEKNNKMIEDVWKSFKFEQ